jgi:hypothetical protein
MVLMGHADHSGQASGWFFKVLVMRAAMNSSGAPSQSHGIASADRINRVQAAI